MDFFFFPPSASTNLFFSSLFSLCLPARFAFCVRMCWFFPPHSLFARSYSSEKNIKKKFRLFSMSLAGRSVLACFFFCCCCHGLICEPTQTAQHQPLHLHLSGLSFFFAAAADVVVNTERTFHIHLVTFNICCSVLLSFCAPIFLFFG